MKKFFKCLLVVGGNDHDSTEIFSDNSWRIVSSKLSSKIIGMQVGNINNKVLLFGK